MTRDVRPVENGVGKARENKVERFKMPVAIPTVAGKIPEGIMNTHADKTMAQAKPAAASNADEPEEYCKLPIDGFIRLNEVLAILGLKKTTFQKGIREGTLPKPYKFGPRISLWSIEEIRSAVDKIKQQSQDHQSFG